jgi:preprotein translocase subunit SecG
MYSSRRAPHAGRFKGVFVGPLNIILVVIWAISAVASILLILMHSGKGTGVSDMIAASMYSNNAGSGVWEKNLDRLTLISTITFAVTLFIFMMTFPLGSIG